MDEDATIPDLPVTKQSRWFRRFFIAVSIFFGILTLALAVIWVQSYSDCCGIEKNDGVFTAADCCQGAFAVYRNEPMGRGLHKDVLRIMPGSTTGGSDKSYWRDYKNFRIYVPIWQPTLLTAIASLAPWTFLPWRFSLRTMLIVTTLVAVVLGLMVWVVRMMP